MKTTQADYISQLQAATSKRSLNEALKKYLSHFGITMFAFTYYSYSPKSIHKIKYDYASPQFTSWHQHYLSEGYEDIDSTLDSVYQSVIPHHWDIEEQLKQAVHPRERRMRKDALKFGAEKGMSIPIHGPHDDFAILVVVQMRGQSFLEKNPELQQALFLAGYYYYHYLQPYLLESPNTTGKLKLTAREMQCLTLIAKNYSLSQMAKVLSLTERTVNYHIQRLNKKLGTSNKYQSVIKALIKGLIVI